MTTGKHYLAIETSGRVGSVCIGTGPNIHHAAVFQTDLNHAVELLPTIDRLCTESNLAPADLDAVFVSGGPGSFTGLRIGITAARTLAWSTGAKTIRVPTLDAIAQNALRTDDPPDHVGVILDAKRKAVFATAYQRENDRYVAIEPPAERDPDQFLASIPRPCAILGEGIPYHQTVIDRSRLPILDPETSRARAKIIYQLGAARAVRNDFDNPNELIPIYIRRPEAEEVWEKRQRQSNHQGS